jgi:antitoxin component of RelBE/YafQ-DinJ toxin-antitoxin module
MPNVIISDETFQRIAERAAALNVPVNALIESAVHYVAKYGSLPSEPPSPLTGDAWVAAMDEAEREARSRAGRYPAGFVVDDSRETIYGERLDAQR